MGLSFHPSTRAWICGVGFAALAACVDPFGFDNKSQTDTSGAGGGGGRATNGSSSSDVTSSSSGPTDTSTSSSTGGAGGSGGSTASTGGASSSGGAGGGGTAGSGGSTMGSGGSGTGGMIADAGKPDVAACVVKPPQQGPADGGPLGRVTCAPGRFPLPNPDPDAAEIGCPANLAELDRIIAGNPIDACTPPPHPAADCPFYFFSWHNFMLATKPADTAGTPAFLSWATIERTFGSGAGQPAPAIPQILGGVTQAGGRQVLIDQNGHAIYYAIHFNQPFTNFVNDNCLTTPEAVRNADPMLRFPSGLVELKEAWMIVPDNMVPTDFIVARVQVPTLHRDPASPTNVLEDHTQMRTVTAALLAIHIVFTLPGHPEFIWSTFQHVNAQTAFDVAPEAVMNPEATPVGTVINQQNFLLYKGGTAANAANRGVASLTLDEATQTFTNQQTSIYRMFPASKFTTTEFDGDVGTINDNMTAKFRAANLPANDRRSHYRLVGATWQDRPLETMLAPNKILTNDETIPDIQVNGSDSPLAILAGEDRLSSVAMESFTQPTNSFPNCFACHDTRATTARGVPLARDMTGMQLLQPKLINVSHVFNEVVRLNP